jgi:hypothetical protein
VLMSLEEAAEFWFWIGRPPFSQPCDFLVGAANPVKTVNRYSDFCMWSRLTVRALISHYIMVGPDVNLSKEHLPSIMILR